jgi:hypothetical protein
MDLPEPISIEEALDFCKFTPKELVEYTNNVFFKLRKEFFEVTPIEPYPRKRLLIQATSMFNYLKETNRLAKWFYFKTPNIEIITLKGPHPPVYFNLKRDKPKFNWNWC